MLRQGWAILVLKWRILVNTWSAGKLVSLVILGILFVGLSGVSLAGGVGMFFVGRQWLAEQQPLPMLIVLDSFVVFFLFFWVWGMLFELQRSDVLDFRKMLHLSASLRMIFGLNFAASLFSPALLFFIPAMLGLLAGLATHHGPRLLTLGIPLSAVFFLMLGAWAFYARGVLAILMEDKRRRRVIMTVLPVCFVMLSQMPNLIIQSFRSPGKKQTVADFSHEQAAMALQYGNVAVPIGWLPLGLWSLVQGETLIASGCLAALLGAAGAGLGLGYRSTLRHYTGKTRGRVRRKKRLAAAAGKPGAVLTARRLPFAGEDTAAMTWAVFLSYLRHPNIRILMIMPVCMGLFLLFMHHSGAYGERLSVSGAWLPIIVLVWPFFNFSFIFFNLFGIDRAGFQELILLPTPRHKYLLAKNLALFPFVAGLSLAFVLTGALLLATETRLILISVMQVLQLYLTYCLVGNFVSLYFPYRLGRDTLRARNNRPIMLVVGLASAATVGLLLLPTTLCMVLDDWVEATWGYHGWPIGLTASAALVALTALAYAISLTHAGDLLLAREQRVWEALVRDRE